MRRDAAGEDGEAERAQTCDVPGGAVDDDALDPLALPAGRGHVAEAGALREAAGREHDHVARLGEISGHGTDAPVRSQARDGGPADEGAAPYGFHVGRHAAVLAEVVEDETRIERAERCDHVGRRPLDRRDDHALVVVPRGDRRRAAGSGLEIRSGHLSSFALVSSGRSPTYSRPRTIRPSSMP